MKFIIKPGSETQLPAILEILNDAILNTSALYDYKPRTMENMKHWYHAKQEGNYPIVGVFEAENGTLCGFASYGPFRNWPAYKYTVEHSVYVRSDMRGQGLGKLLLQEIIEKAREQDYHCIIGGIDSSNQVSKSLHEKAGFIYCGTIQHAGYKFGRWLDLSFYQLILKTPVFPVEDK